MFCWPCIDLHRAVALVISNEDSKYIKRIVIRILRDYAKNTSNLVDDALVDEIERKLFNSLWCVSTSF